MSHQLITFVPVFILRPLRGRQQEMDARCAQLFPQEYSQLPPILFTPGSVIRAPCALKALWVPHLFGRSGNGSGFRRGKASVALVCRRFPAPEFHLTPN